VTVVPVPRQQPVEALLHTRCGARTDGLLTIIEVTETPDLLQSIHLASLLLEPPDEKHFFQQSLKKFLIVTFNWTQLRLLS